MNMQKYELRFYLLLHLFIQISYKLTIYEYAHSFLGVDFQSDILVIGYLETFLRETTKLYDKKMKQYLDFASITSATENAAIYILFIYLLLLIYYI